MYMTDNIFPDIPIKHLINKDGEPNTPHKVVIDINLYYQNLRVYSVHVLY